MEMHRARDVVLSALSCATFESLTKSTLAEALMSIDDGLFERWTLACGNHATAAESRAKTLRDTAKAVRDARKRQAEPATPAPRKASRRKATTRASAEDAE